MTASPIVAPARNAETSCSAGPSPAETLGRPALRVAFLCHSFKVHGGAEQLILSLAAGLAQRGHSVTVFTRDYDASHWGDPLALGFAVQEVHAANDYVDAASFRDWARVGHWLAPRLLGFDVIVANIVPSMMWWHYACVAAPGLRAIASVWYCHGFVGWFNPGATETHAVAAALDAACGHRISLYRKVIARLRTSGPLSVAMRAVRQVLTLGSPSFTQHMRKLECEIVPRFDRVLTNSDFTGQNVRKAFGVDTVTCHPGIPVEPISASDEADAGYILALARLDASKNVMTVLQAVAILRDKGTLPFAGLVVAGAGPGEADLRKFCCEHGLDSLVQFAGPVAGPDKDRLCERAALFVLPCLDEGFGLVFVEAGGHCVPAIGPDHGGPAEIIVPGETGWLVDPLDPAALASAILEAFSDRDRLSAFGVAAGKRAHGVFSEAAFVERFEQAVRTVVDSRRPGNRER